MARVKRLRMIAGPNGSGKSELFKNLALERSPSGVFHGGPFVSADVRAALAELVRASRLAKISPSRRQSKRSRVSSRPSCRGSKRSTSRTMLEELTGFFRRYGRVPTSNQNTRASARIALFICSTSTVTRPTAVSPSSSC